MKKIFFLALIFIQINVLAQQSFSVSDSLPVTSEGLQAGYNIAGASEKEVGDKGNFSRYKIHFYITNVSSQAKLILYRPNNSFFGGNTSPDLVQFRCSNATGARLTNKDVTLKANPCVIDALVNESDATGKTVQAKKQANIGYWIKPGESIAVNAIMIVPLNEKPDMTVNFFPNSSSMGGTVINNEYTNNNNNNSNNNNNYGQQNYQQGFVRIKNFASNNYLHNQNGPMACTSINFDWWSAQWEFIPVNGSNNFQIRNRWKNNFISTENGNMLSNNGQSAKSMWTIEESNTSNVFYIKNAADNSKLIFQNGQLKTSNSYTTDATVQWVIEK